MSEWVMPAIREPESVKPASGWDGPMQTIADICLRQWANDPETLLPLLESMERDWESMKAMYPEK